MISIKFAFEKLKLQTGERFSRKSVSNVDGAVPGSTEGRTDHTETEGGTDEQKHEPEPSVVTLADLLGYADCKAPLIKKISHFDNIF